MIARRDATEVLLWALLALAAAAAMCAARPAALSNDSYRYLDAAAQIRNGRGLTASMVYYDLERSHGRVPLPLTHWPPGYPVAIATASALTGGELDGAARAVSCLAYAGTAALLAWALLLAGAPRVLRVGDLSLFLANAVALGFATAALSESLFMCGTTAVVVGLMRSEDETRPDRSRTRAAAVACAIAGLTYWIRYAGIFVVAGVVCYAALQCAMHRTRLRALFLSLTAIPIGMVGALAIRNAWLVGNWRGGNEMPTDYPLTGVLRDYLTAHLHLALGNHAFTFGLREGVVTAGLLTAAVALILRGRRPHGRGPAQRAAAWCGGRNAVLVLTTVVVLLYTAGMIYAGTTSVVSFGTRMFVPILPLYLLLAAMAVRELFAHVASGPSGVLFNVALALACVGYAGVNARDLSVAQPLGPDQMVATSWAKRAANGKPLGQWIDDHVAPDDVILAGEGQATGFVLQRSTVGLVTAEFSPERWTCATVRREMDRYGAKYVVLYKPPALGLDDARALLQTSPFVAASMDGPPPCGCVVAAENSDIRILSCLPST